jgi:glycosyltransferase involved in cell wall biosynthesis
MNEKLLTVIVPTYSVEKYIRQCLDSIINQTYRNLEIIIIDDCSKDSTPEIIKEYAEKDSRIKTVFHKENTGPGKSRNEGVKMATGEYITFVDSDDWQDLTKYEKMMDRTPCDIIFCCAAEHDTEENQTKNLYKIPDIFKNEKITNLSTWETKEILLFPLSFIPPWAKIVRTEMVDKYKIRFSEDGNQFEDVLFHYLSIIHAEKVSFIDEVLYTHRFLPESLTGVAQRKQAMYFDIIKTWFELEKYAIRFDYDPKKILILYFKMLSHYMFVVKDSLKYRRIVKDKIIKKYNLKKSDFPKHLRKYYNYFIFFPFWKLRSKYITVRIRPIKGEYKIVLFGKRLL